MSHLCTCGGHGGGGSKAQAGQGGWTLGRGGVHVRTCWARIREVAQTLPRSIVLESWWGGYLSAFPGGNTLGNTNSQVSSCNLNVQGIGRERLQDQGQGCTPSLHLFSRPEGTPPFLTSAEDTTQYNCTGCGNKASRTATWKARAMQAVTGTQGLW